MTEPLPPAPRVEVARRVRFEAAHYLPEYDGACSQLHGHSFVAWLTCAGEVQPAGSEEGMVVDMGAIGAWWKAHLEPRLDHAVLNEVVPPAYLPPSTENVARFIGDRARAAGLPVVRVELHETENQKAVVSW